MRRECLMGLERLPRLGNRIRPTAFFRFRIHGGRTAGRPGVLAAGRGSRRLLILLPVSEAGDNRRVPGDEIETEAAPATAATRPSAGCPGTRCHGPGRVGDPVGPGADVERGGDAG